MIHILFDKFSGIYILFGWGISSQRCTIFGCTCLIRYVYFTQVKDVVYEVIEGDPRNILPEAVEKYRADVLVVGSHGYGAIKRYT